MSEGGRWGQMSVHEPYKSSDMGRRRGRGPAAERERERLVASKRARSIAVTYQRDIDGESDRQARIMHAPSAGHSPSLRTVAPGPAPRTTALRTSASVEHVPPGCTLPLLTVALRSNAPLGVKTRQRRRPDLTVVIYFCKFRAGSVQRGACPKGSERMSDWG